MDGYAGSILRVDLSSMETSEEPYREKTAEKYLGGTGIAAKILYEELSEDVDPLQPENKLVVATGTLTGTPAAAGNRTLLATKSALTGLWGHAAMGGKFGGELKRAGFDVIVVEGTADTPVYLWVHDGKAEIKDGTDLWGEETGPVEDSILAEVGDAKVLSIGPAGENLVSFASVLSELRFSASRGGLGAVMGSKQLKAIAVSGDQSVSVADPDSLAEQAAKINKEFQTDGSCDSLMNYGTWNNLTPLQDFGILPTENFRAGVIEGGDTIKTETINEFFNPDRYTCPGCSIACRPIVNLEEPPVSGRYGGPQYETVASFGPLLGNLDRSSIAKAHELCNRFGMDTMSTGVSIAWAAECSEVGVDLGESLRWGDSEKILELIEDIAHRRGVGDLLANGVKKASEEVGHGSEDWTLQVKGLEMAMHDPRGKKGMGLNYATNNRGADHLQIIHEEAMEAGGPFPELGLDSSMKRTELEGKPFLVKTTQDYFGVLPDSLGVCKFPLNAWRPFTPKRLTTAVNYVTGWDLSLEDLMTNGERIYNLCRLFNIREGVTRENDTVPVRLSEPFSEGNTAGETLTKEDLSKMLDEYYDLRGWDREGIPTEETLRRLEIEP